VSESLSMLPYGFAPHEIVYKRRLGEQKRDSGKPSSEYDDGKIGWAKLALRGQDTILKWFFDEEGNVTGLTQQPWFGGLIDIPIEKLLLFRPRAWKNNPEGYSILRIGLPAVVVHQAPGRAGSDLARADERHA
jgi:hypothetical protein